MDDEVRVLLDEARTQRRAGSAEDALQTYHRAAGHARHCGDAEGLACALRNVADLTRELDEPAASLIAAEEAVGLYRALGEGEALSLAHALRLAALALEEADRDAAAHWREAQALYHECGEADCAAECAAHLAG